MITALKTSMGFEPNMAVALDAAATTDTTDNFAPTLGVLAFIPYKPARCRFVARLDAAPTQGDVTIKVVAGGSVVGQVSQSLNGVTVIDGVFDVNLAGVDGSAALKLAVEVTAVADAGRTAQVSGALDIEQPIQSGGC